MHSCLADGDDGRVCSSRNRRDVGAASQPVIALSMQGRLICALVLLAVLASACSRQETPKTLASRLSKADRVIVLNPIGGFTKTIQDELLSKLVRALETSKRISDPETLTVTPGYTLIFFRSQVHLATITTGSGTIFYIDEAAYRDESGVLRDVSHRMYLTELENKEREKAATD